MLAILDTNRLAEAIASNGVSQAAIARKSGVSRAQLNRLVSARGGSVRVRQRTVEQLARAMEVSPESLLAGGSLSPYKSWLAQETRLVDFRGFGIPGVQRQAIQDIFVDLGVAEVPKECKGDLAPHIPRSGKAGRRSDRPIAATNCVLSNDRLILLGGPGSGKTTLLRYVAHESAVSREATAETPILVRLPELLRAIELDDRVDPVKFMAAQPPGENCHAIEAMLRQELTHDQRRCLVLLDGLDEVGNQEQLDRLVKHIRAFVEEYPRNRFVVTSRPAGFDASIWQGMGFAVYRIMDFNRPRLEQFADCWAKVLSRTEGKPYAEVKGRLGRAIFTNPRVHALTSTPLILTILLLLNEARGGVLPRRRVDLYEKVIDVFLDTWESNKRSDESFDDARGVTLYAREFRWLLSELALAMQKADRTLAPRWWIAEKIEDYLQNKLGFAADVAKDSCDRIYDTRPSARAWSKNVDWDFSVSRIARSRSISRHWGRSTRLTRIRFGA